MRAAAVLLGSALLAFADGPAVREGETWFRLNAGGSTPGFALFTVARAKDGGLSATFELRYGTPGGGSRQEERTLKLAADGTLLEASATVVGGPDGKVKREEKRLVGSGRRSASEKPIDVALEGLDFAVAGPLAVSVALLPREKGTTREWTEVNLFGPPSMGTKITATCLGPEEADREGTKVPATRYDLVRAEAPTMKVWIAADGTVLRIEPGPGVALVWSSKPTRDLFRTEEPAVREVPGQEGQLTLAGGFAKFTPEEVFDHFTKPDLLAKWWAPQSEVGDKAGGAYILKYPDQGWVLRGEIKEFERGTKLAFTWKWDHEPKEKAALDVVIELTPMDGGGTRIGLTHGPYGIGKAGDKERGEHLEGWKYFLGRLKALNP